MPVFSVVQRWCPWCAGHMGWGMGWMWIFWLVVLIALVAVVWMAMRRGGGPPPAAGGDRAEEALRERYARGEIDEPTYRRMLDELRRS
jgi:putative membrane protein